jgi:capsular exopolysaccharide synthesis family protein
MNKIETLPKREDNDIYFSDFIKTVLPHKWSIFFITLMVLILTNLYLYFTAPTYESSATIKIKTDKKLDKLALQDPIRRALSQSDASNIEQEIAILNSFYISNKAIEKLNMKVQYFTKKGYKKIEYFENPPIEIQNITIYNNKIAGEEFILHPEKNGFKIEQKDTPISQLFQYNQEIQLKDFKCTIKKESNLYAPIYFKLNGSNRDIYENIVKKRLKISQLNIDVSIIKLSYQDTSIKRANAYINGLIDVYLAQSVSNKNRESTKVLNFINQQLETTGQGLQKSEIALQEYRVNNKVIEPTKQSRLLLDRLNAIEIEIEENKIKKSLVKNLLILLENSQYLENMLPTLKALEEQSTIELIQKIEEMKQNIDTLSIKFTEKHPDLILLRRQMKKSQNKVYGNIKNIQLTINQRRKSLNKQKKKNEIKLKKLPKKEKQLIQFQRNYDVNAKMYAYLLEKKSENSLKRVATLSDYEVIDSAYSSSKPIKPKKAMLLIASGIVGLMLGVFIAYLRNRLSQKIQTIRDIQELTSLPIYGEIPMLSKRDTASEVLEHPNSILTTYFRKLRTTLQLLTNKSKGNSLLITSSMPNEGKTEIILNLTNLFQLAGYKSIIIDLDLYQPSLHHHFNIKSNRGISTYLNHRDDIEDIIFKTEHQHLDIILAGEEISNPSELLLSQKLTLLLSTLEKSYDYIFINAAPLMVVEETLYLMQFTDTNLIVIRENFTKKSFLINLNKTLEQYAFKNIRLLFNTKQEGKDND